jgi:hypothetical protein
MNYRPVAWKLGQFGNYRDDRGGKLMKAAQGGSLDDVRLLVGAGSTEDGWSLHPVEVFFFKAGGKDLHVG